MTLDPSLKRTPLYDLHVELGGKMVPFAGYEMPVQFPLGIMKEHLHTREAAGLFDVSHMGQALLKPGTDEDAAVLLETLVPGNIAGLKPGQMRYTVLLNAEGGIMDDLMVTRLAVDPKTLYLVVNAACKEEDFAHIASSLKGKATLERLDDRALLALQGPKAAEVLSRHVPGLEEVGFMNAIRAEIDGADCHMGRSGYTGEDGFEISVAEEDAVRIVRLLLSHDEVESIGLGARDSLRLEAGLCLYGHDIDQSKSPVEGNIAWAVPKVRRERADFPGAGRILRELSEGVAKKLVGILPNGRQPAREGTDIVDGDGAVIGTVTSGGFGPTFGGPVAMGYVPREFSENGTEIGLSVRGKILPAKVAPMPFVEKRFYRKPQ